MKAFEALQTGGRGRLNASAGRAGVVGRTEVEANGSVNVLVLRPGPDTNVRISASGNLFKDVALQPRADGGTDQKEFRARSHAQLTQFHDVPPRGVPFVMWNRVFSLHCSSELRSQVVRRERLKKDPVDAGLTCRIDHLGSP